MSTRTRIRQLLIFSATGILMGTAVWFLAMPVLAKTAISKAAVTCTVDDDLPADYTAIQTAVNDPTCDIITVAPGIYQENITISRDVTIQGSGVLSSTIDGRSLDQVILIDNAAAVVNLSQLAITGGNTWGDPTRYAGGIHNEGMLTINNLLFSANQGHLGGAISNTGSLTMTRSALQTNSAEWDGGGLFNSGLAAIQETLFISNNAARNGGGVATDKSPGQFTSISQTILQENHAGGTGGGVLANGNLEIDHTSLLTNTTGAGINSPGGAIYMTGILTITNSTVSGNNSGSGAGGGINVSEWDCAHLILVNTTVSNNSGAFGDGIAAYSAATQPSCRAKVEIFKSDISYNQGNGIYGADMIVRNSHIHHNTNNGISHDGLSLTMSHNLVEANNNFGVAMSQGILTNNTIQDNGSSGLYCDTGKVTLQYTTVTNNHATGNGGGILATSFFSPDCILEINGSLIENNFSESNGGGIYSTGLLTVTNSTISGNATYGNGGGIMVTGVGLAHLDSNTIAYNIANYNVDASGDGGGVYRDANAGTIFAQNNIIAKNKDFNFSPGDSYPDCYGDFSSGVSNLIGVYDGVGCTGFGSALDRRNQDPMLLSLTDNGGPTLTHALSPGSPAIDWFTNCPSVDQRGVARPQDGGTGSAYCDIGAYEVGTCSVPIAPALSIDSENTWVNLSWTNHSPNRESEIWRGTAAFDDTSYANYWSVQGATNKFSDYDALETPATDNFYKVRGQNACGSVSTYSNVVGEIDLRIKAGNGRHLKFSLLSIPLSGNIPATADALANQIGPGIIKVAKWKPQTRSWKVRTVGAGFGTPDFALALGDVVMIAADDTAPDTFAWVGGAPNTGAYHYTLQPLNANFVTVPLTGIGIYPLTADGLGYAVGGVRAVAAWNRPSQSWQIRIVGIAGPNFPIELGRPYVLLTNNNPPSVWP